jgi:hypothetical protein
MLSGIKMKKNFLRFTLVGIIFVFSNLANAVVITAADQVSIGDKVWAKVGIFSGLSYNDIDLQCPLTVCSGTSSLNGYDMDGWIWASAVETTTMLNTFSIGAGFTPEDGNSYTEYDSSWGPTLIATFGSTEISLNAYVRYGYYQAKLSALTSDRLGDLYSLDISDKNGTISIDSVSTISRDNFIDTYTNEFAGYFYKTAVHVDAPSSLAIFALGLMGLASRRFRSIRGQVA